MNKMVSLNENTKTLVLGLSVLFHNALPKQYRTEAFYTAIFLINRLTSCKPNMDSLFKILFRKYLDYIHLCACLTTVTIHIYKIMVNTNFLQNLFYVFSLDIVCFTKDIGASFLRPDEFRFQYK